MGLIFCILKYHITLMSFRIFNNIFTVINLLHCAFELWTSESGKICQPNDALFLWCDRCMLMSLWQVCRDFMMGRCFRPNCRYLHSQEAKDAESRDICKDFMNGKCNRSFCRFYHPPSALAGATTVTSVPLSSSVCFLHRNAMCL